MHSYQYVRTIHFRNKKTQQSTNWYNIPMKSLRVGDVFKFRSYQGSLNIVVEVNEYEISYINKYDNYSVKKKDNSSLLWHCWINPKHNHLVEKFSYWKNPETQEVTKYIGCLQSRRSDMEYNDKQINSMILYLRVNRVAEVQYIDREIINTETTSVDTGDLKLYDYMSSSHLSVKQLISAAIESGWTEDWKT